MPGAMVIDDSRAIRLILSRTLEGLGFDVREASNGLEAIGLLTLDPTAYALILVDWNMPGLDGINFLKFVRSRPEYQNVRLLMVTTETNSEQMLEALEAGADEYVMKPFTREIIEGKLRLMHVLPDGAASGVQVC